MMTFSPWTLGLMSGTGLALASSEPWAWWLAFVALVPLMGACRRSRGAALAAAGSTSLAMVVVVFSGVLTVAQGKTVFAGILIGNFLHLCLFAAALHGFGQMGERWRVFGGATVWMASEYLRAQTTSASPLALALHEQTGWIQLAAWTGVLGISFALVWTNGVLAAWLVQPRRVWLLAGVLPVFGLACVPERQAEPAGAPLRVVAVQGGISESQQRRMRSRELSPRLAYETYLELTKQALRFEPDMVAWPEISVFGWNDAVPDWRQQLAHLRSCDTHYLVGTQRETPQGNFNSALLLGPTGDILETYDKRRLVPITESGLTPGHGDGLIDVGACRLGLGICYEVVFPHLARQQVRDGAQALMVLSNSAALSGALPRIQSAHAVFRAVETGRWMVTVNAVEESRIIDAAGRTVAISPTDSPAVVPAWVQTRADLTPYVLFGDWFPLSCIGGLIVGWVRRRTSR